MSMYNELLLQDMFNFMSVELLLFHDYSMMLLMSILVGFVVMMIAVLRAGGFLVSGYASSSKLEFAWTILPGMLLYSLGVPSLFLMYWLEGALKYDLTMKVVGHQWYWSYEMMDLGLNLEFDSYMVKTDSDLLSLSDPYRLLEVDNSVVLPYLSKIRALVTSSDVLHSWALPSMALKVDACPGRLNFMNLYSMRPSSVYGQCSEICGVNHSFMPIHVEFISWPDFLVVMNGLSSD